MTHEEMVQFRAESEARRQQVAAENARRAAEAAEAQAEADRRAGYL